MELVATLLVNAGSVYLVLGLLFAVPFALRGADRIDPAARGSSWGFRLVTLPGVVALWPLLLRRWLGGAGPPEERTPHRLAAKEGP